MQVKKEIFGEEYIKLIDYIFQRCEFISVIKRSDQHALETSRVKKIFELNGYSKKKIINCYSENFLKEIYEKQKDNSLIFDENYKNKFEINNSLDSKIFEELKKENRERLIKETINKIMYYHMIELWLNKHKKDIVHKKEDFYYDYMKQEKMSYGTIYILRLSSEMKEDLLNKRSLYSWCFPLSVEDISFFKDGYCWLYSVAHEEICEIYCEDKEEYEYLKSIGIEFWEKEFVPTSKEDLYFENYK